MKRFLEVEPLIEKPAEFDGWYEETCELADAEGEATTIGVLMTYAPLECLRYLGSQQPLVASLLARARLADRARFMAGVYRGRQLGCGPVRCGPAR